MSQDHHDVNDPATEEDHRAAYTDMISTIAGIYFAGIHGALNACSVALLEHPAVNIVVTDLTVADDMLTSGADESKIHDVAVEMFTLTLGDDLAELSDYLHELDPFRDRVSIVVVGYNPDPNLEEQQELSVYLAVAWTVESAWEDMSDPMCDCHNQNISST